MVLLLTAFWLDRWPHKMIITPASSNLLSVTLMSTLNCCSSVQPAALSSECLQLDGLFENVRDGQEEEQMGTGEGGR